MTGSARITVRRLGLDDVDALKQLLAVFANVFERPDVYLGSLPRESYLERLLGNSAFIVIVAEIEGHVVGGLAAYVLEKFEQERSEIYIMTSAFLKPFAGRALPHC